MSWQGSYRTSPSHYSGGCPNLSYYSSISRPINFPSWWLSARMGFWKAAGTKRKGNCEQVLCTDLQWPWTTQCRILLVVTSLWVSGWLLWDDASGCWWIFCVVVGASHFVSGAVGLNWKKIEFTRTQLLERECSGAAIKYQTQLLFRLFYETQEQTLWLHFAGTYFNLSGCNGAQDTASPGKANGDNNLQNGLQSHRINCKMINTVIVLRANSKFIFAPFYFALHPLMR